MCALQGNFAELERRTENAGGSFTSLPTVVRLGLGMNGVVTVSDNTTGFAQDSTSRVAPTSVKCSSRLLVAICFASRGSRFHFHQVISLAQPKNA